MGARSHPLCRRVPAMSLACSSVGVFALAFGLVPVVVAFEGVGVASFGGWSLVSRHGPSFRGSPGQSKYSVR